MSGGGPHRIQASIRPHLLDDVVEALDDIGILELVAIDARGFTGRARRSVYRGTSYLALEERTVIDVVTDRHAVDLVVDLIAANAWTGFPGDGSVWTCGLHRAVDVRTWPSRHRSRGR